MNEKIITGIAFIIFILAVTGTIAIIEGISNSFIEQAVWKTNVEIRLNNLES